jgi:hypothetical protein
MDVMEAIRTYRRHVETQPVQISTGMALHTTLDALTAVVNLHKPVLESSSFDSEHTWTQCQECLKNGDCPTIQAIAKAFGI